MKNQAAASGQRYSGTPIWSAAAVMCCRYQKSKKYTNNSTIISNIPPTNIDVGNEETNDEIIQDRINYNKKINNTFTRTAKTIELWFLGFTGYYRRFVPDYSTVAQPLVRLLGKDCKFKWTDACQDAFKTLRALLIKAPVLAFPKEDLPYIVDTDASDYGIGGVLSQCIEGTEHVIAYYSKSLNPAQQKYCTTRRELLAVVATLDHFKGYVWGPRFLIRTDHAALVWLTNLKNIQGMLARWLAKLQQFNFDIVHRPGAQHGNADGLSRCPQCERGSCAPTTNTHQTDPDQPYAYSCGGSSLDSELIPLESGETCVAAIMTAQSENSKLIIAAQKIDNEISIVRRKISCLYTGFRTSQLRTESILDWQKEPILGHRKHFVATSFSNRVARAASCTDVPARHNL